MHPRQRIETEPGVREPLSALRQLASIYPNSPANPLEAPRTFRALHNAWWHHARLLYQAQSGQASSSTADPGLDVRQWHRFLRNQLSQDELETVAKLVFHDDGVWARGQQGESGRRLQALKSNMGQQYEEMLMLLLGADIPRSWNAIKNINSLLKARDPTKRKSLDAVLDAITAAAIDRHELGEKPESTPPELLPVDIETAFRDAAYQPPSKRARATTTTPDAAKPSVETDDEEEAENARGRSNDVAPDVEELGPILDDSPIARFKGKQPALPEPLSAPPGPIPND
ncbi:hypothetical protein COL922a_010421 [Colletotrichum nupharicola]|nr:hypothetical protein COL922a_010421 [Colletotrichum nupharicola]